MNVERKGGADISLLELHRISQQFRMPKIQQPSKREAQLAGFGRDLFFDKGLSANKSVSCSSCHKPKNYFTDGLEVSVGISKGSKNAPTLINSFLGTWFFWNGRSDSLEDQATRPIQAANEHGFSKTKTLSFIVRNYLKEYEELFGNIPLKYRNYFLHTESCEKFNNPGPSRDILYIAYETIGDSDTFLSLSKRLKGNTDSLATLKEFFIPVSEKNSECLSLSEKDEAFLDGFMLNIGKAIATFEKGIVSNDSPFDAFLEKWSIPENPSLAFKEKFSREEFEGLSHFVGKGRCVFCHSGPNFTDNQFHNIALPQRGDHVDLGRTLGIFIAQNSPLNCRHEKLEANRKMESCRELAFLNGNSPEFIGAFKTPSLRNVKKTAPYMHDGRFKEISHVLEHYNKMNSRPAVGHKEETLIPLKLTKKEILSLKKFLFSLTGSVKDKNLNQ